MSTERFTSVIQGLRKLSGRGSQPLPDESPLEKDGVVFMEVNGVMFSLFLEQKEPQELLMIHCDFGVVPPELCTEAYRALLTANLSIYTGTGPALTVSPITGRVTLADNYPLEVMTPRLLAGFLSVLAKQALAWRDGYFLEGKSG